MFFDVKSNFLQTLVLGLLPMGPAYSLVSVLKADFSLLEADCTLLPHICDHIDRQSPTFSPITKGLF